MDNGEYKYLLQEALKYGNKRDYVKAAGLFKKIISETDSIPEAFLYLGRSYHVLKEYKLAIQAYKYFIALQPETGAGYFFIGRAYLACNMPKFAVRYLKKAEEIQNNSSKCKSYLGFTYLKLKRPDLAVRYLEEAVELEPDNRTIYTGYLNAVFLNAVRYFYRENLDLAKQMFEFLQQAGYCNISIHLYLAIIEKDTGDYNKALYHYNEAVKISPDDSLLRFQRAGLLFLTGNKTLAVEELNKLNILDNPEDFSWDMKSINRFLAVQHFQQGKYRKAAYSGIQVLRKEDDNDMHLLVGESYRYLEDYEKAQNHFKIVHERDRKNLESRYGLAMILWQNEEWESMLKELNLIEKIDPGNEISAYYNAMCICKLSYPAEETIPAVIEQIKTSGPDLHLLTTLGEQYIRGKITYLAEKWFKKALLLESKHKPAHLGLISVYKELGKVNKLSKQYKDYLEIFNDDLPVRKDFIQILFNEKKYKYAADEIEKALPYFQDDTNSQRLLAVCYRKTGKYLEASIIYRQLLRENLSNDLYLRSLIYCMEKDGNRKGAIKLLEKALNYLKPSSSLLLINGVLLYKEKEMEKALASFRKVLDIKKDDWRVYNNMGLIYKEKGIDEIADKYLKKAEMYKNK